jgi:hypothetical protein
MPKRDKDGREYIEQDGKRYYQNFGGQWEAEKDWFGNDKVQTDCFGKPKIKTDIFGNQIVETDWKGSPIIEPEKKKDDSGSCYLTTACMRAMRDDFFDDCAELTTLRHFRDTYLKEKHSEDIIEYYEVAPLIVTAINESLNRQDLYVRMYEDLVLGTVSLIKRGHFEKAYLLYKNYGESLMAKYSISKSEKFK